jgi:hypothetical protein
MPREAISNTQAKFEKFFRTGQGINKIVLNVCPLSFAFGILGSIRGLCASIPRCPFLSFLYDVCVLPKTHVQH